MMARRGGDNELEDVGDLDISAALSNLAASPDDIDMITSFPVAGGYTREDMRSHVGEVMRRIATAGHASAHGVDATSERSSSMTSESKISVEQTIEKILATAGATADRVSAPMINDCIAKAIIVADTRGTSDHMNSVYDLISAVVTVMGHANQQSAAVSLNETCKIALDYTQALREQLDQAQGVMTAMQDVMKEVKMVDIYSRAVRKIQKSTGRWLAIMDGRGHLRRLPPEFSAYLQSVSPHLYAEILEKTGEDMVASEALIRHLHDLWKTKKQ